MRKRYRAEKAVSAIVDA